jgi:hypothetical protein
MVEALALAHYDAAAIYLLNESADELALADTRLSCDKHELASTRESHLESRFEFDHFGGATNKGARRTHICAAPSGDMGSLGKTRGWMHQAVAAPVLGLNVEWPARVVPERLAQFLNA